MGRDHCRHPRPHRELSRPKAPTAGKRPKAGSPRRDGPAHEVATHEDRAASAVRVAHPHVVDVAHLAQVDAPPVHELHPHHQTATLRRAPSPRLAILSHLAAPDGDSDVIERRWSRLMCERAGASRPRRCRRSPDNGHENGQRDRASDDAAQQEQDDTSYDERHDESERERNDEKDEATLLAAVIANIALQPSMIVGTLSRRLAALVARRRRPVFAAGVGAVHDVVELSDRTRDPRPAILQQLDYRGRSDRTE